MRLPRPHIPMRVRVGVAWTRAYAMGLDPSKTISRTWSCKDQLHALLFLMFGNEQAHLDHDPPLATRRKIISRKTGEVIGYSPDANDPEYLVYRTKEDHRVKTLIRGEHGQHPDRVLIKRARRRERKKKPQRWRAYAYALAKASAAKRKRAWSKRKIQSRNNLRRQEAAERKT